MQVTKLLTHNECICAKSERKSKNKEVFIIIGDFNLVDVLLF